VVYMCVCLAIECCLVMLDVVCVLVLLMVIGVVGGGCFSFRTMTDLLYKFL